jgi:hypothetical protein
MARYRPHLQVKWNIKLGWITRPLLLPNLVLTISAPIFNSYTLKHKHEFFCELKLLASSTLKARVLK